MRRFPRPNLSLIAAAVAIAVALAAVLVAMDLSSGARGSDDDRRPAPRPLTPTAEHLANEWRTDFSIRTVRVEELNLGGPARDAIPAIDEPKMVTADAEGLDPEEPVVAVEVDGDPRAYPIQVLVWHEIVNDVVGGEPIAVTFCPLCHSAVAFSRELSGDVLDFSNTGKLRGADLIMYDRGTESWWQQLTGEAIIGELAGSELSKIPARLTTLGDFTSQHPDGLVMSTDTGFERPYGANPFPGYDGTERLPFQLRQEPDDDRVPAKERVVYIEGPGRGVAVPLTAARRNVVTATELGATPVVVWWRPGAPAPLGGRTTRSGPEQGTITVLDARANGRRLTLEPAGDRLWDRQTGSRWRADGLATAGPLRGARLAQVVHDTPFWFGVAALGDRVRVVRR